MRIDALKVGDVRVFRPEGWDGSLIVCEDVKEALERVGATGVKFKSVTDSSPDADSSQDARWQKFRALWGQGHAARETTWRELGDLQEDSIVQIAGGAWPGGQEVWRIIRRPEGRTLFVTEGLSDPYYAQTDPSVGFGIELALETDEPLEAPAKSWAAQMLRIVSDEIAGHDPLREALAEGALSMEISGENMPEPLVTKDGSVGVLLGVASNTLPASFRLPAGEVRLITVKALLPKELSYLLKHGQTELLNRFSKSPEMHLSRSWRKSVV
jgi:hypothetical protein